MILLGNRLHVLFDLLREYQYSVIMADETRIQVLKEPSYSAVGNKYMWVTLGGPLNKRSGDIKWSLQHHRVFYVKSFDERSFKARTRLY